MKSISLLLLTIILIIASKPEIFAQNKKTRISKSTSGWTTSDLTSEFNNIEQYPKFGSDSKNLPQGCLFIEGGTFISGKNYPLEYTQNDSTLWAEPNIRRTTVGSFIMKQTEVTNKEYREFVHWVRDSIARELLYKSNNVYARYFKKVNEEGNILGLDWEEEIDWSDTIALAPIIVPVERRFFNKIELDGRKFAYKMNDKEVLVYPDTLCWLRDFTYSYIEIFANKYFWHPDFDDYPVVGVSLEQAEAFCHWKTKKDWNPNLPLGYYRLPTAIEFEYAALNPSNGKDEKKYNNNEMMKFTGDEYNNENYCIGWNNFENIENVVSKKPKNQKKYFEKVLKNNTTFITNFNTKGVISDNKIYIVSDNADGFLYTSPVGFYRMNHKGFYDLQGNVAEWTSSVFDSQGIIKNSISELLFYLTDDYFPINSHLSDDIEAKFYNSQNSIEFLKSVQLLGLESSRHIKSTIQPEIETQQKVTEIEQKQLEILDKDGKVKFTERFGPFKDLMPDYTREVYASLSLTLGKVYSNKLIEYSSNYCIVIPIDSIVDSNWLITYINTSKEKIAKTITDYNEKLDYYRTIENETFYLLSSLGRIDEILNRYKKFKNRFIVKGGSWAHTVDHTNPFVEHCFYSGQAHSFVGFRYVATVLGPTRYN